MNEIYNKLFVSDELETLWECTSGYMDENDCSWYHQNWLLLRFLGLVSNPMWHEQFYKQAIQRWIPIHDPKVLVLGTADFSMPYLCHQAGLDPIDICDICKTPLNICDWVSRTYSLNWNTFQANIRDGINKTYDAIIDDAFLTRFDYDEKRTILKKIADALEPHGVYITTIRHGWNDGRALIPTEKQRNDFVNRAIDAAIRLKFNGGEPQKAAREYVERMISFPIQDMASLKEMMSGIFEIAECNLAEVTGECELSTYFQVVATKKA